LEAANIDGGNVAARGVVFTDFAGKPGGLIDDDEDRIRRLAQQLTNDKRSQAAQNENSKQQFPS
jgi:hypothetical protein